MSITMPKRYRIRPYIPGVLRAYWGKAENWDEPSLVSNGLKTDAAMLLHRWSQRIEHVPLTAKILGEAFSPSFVEELEARGYDLTSLQFSIRKKEE
jgi:hypothetical protein